tara:strand:- start:195 stop:671 length:477 start_codon:yes stop_codon:yes gene_type:complete
MTNFFASLYYFFYKLSKNKTALFISAVVILFIIIAILYYLYKLKPKLNNTYIDNKEFIKHDSNKDNNATLYFFYTTWCPHCKAANPELDKLKNLIKNGVKGVTVAIVNVDCDKDTEIADQYDITGYPTIKLIYENKIYDYDAKPNAEILLKFLNDSFE